MSYTKVLPLLVALMAGCAIGPDHVADPTDRAGSTKLDALAGDDMALYRKAITSLNNSQLDTAQAEFRRITTTRPDLAGPWANLALIDIRKNDLDSARKNIAKALARNPEMAQAFNLRGTVELRQGNATQAVNDYRRAISAKENYAIAHYNLALVYDNFFQDLKNAIRHYKRYLALTNHQDKKTTEWVAELERNLAKATP